MTEEKKPLLYQITISTEIFFSHFKSECFHLHTFQTASKVKDAVHQYIHVYNHERFQKKLNNLSPYQYRTQAA
ncbi:hypothetical protein COE31_23585 [Priestia megaterium]|nr:IS3 family transposase [Priestia megaterium]PGX73148.1 hypothetical protein COE31_23585 [Priestia megaterium]